MPTETAERPGDSPAAPPGGTQDERRSDDARRERSEDARWGLPARITANLRKAAARLAPFGPGSTVVARSTSGDRRHPVILASVAHPDRADRIVRIAAAIAESQGGRVVVLHVVAEDKGDSTQDVAARWPALGLALAAASAADMPTDYVVRQAANIGRTIRRTAIDEDADLIVLGWRRQGEREHDDRLASLDAVLRNPPCDLAMVGGDGADVPRNIVVPVPENRDVSSALRLAAKLASRGGKLVALRVLREGAVVPDPANAEAALRRAVAEAGIDASAATCLVVKAPNLAAGILGVVDTGYDGVVMVGSQRSLFDKVLFGRTQMYVAEMAEVPVIVTRARTHPAVSALRNGWGLIDELIPDLSPSERSEVREQIAGGSSPTVDFFVMIGLASAIATLGLLTNSAAVIIGAMLVAPLLSAMVGIGFGIVDGDTVILRRALTASLQGALLAILVGAVVGVVHPAGTPKSEILVRTRPNLFDLGIALASGAAGAYALSRRNVQESLAGVAIAAAVIPPLAVVGIGIALLSRPIALGAALLFATNFVAIGLAAAVTFLLLGFRPLLEEQEERRVLFVGLRSATALVIVLGIVLGVLTFRLGSQERFDSHVQDAVRQHVESLGGSLTEVSSHATVNGLEIQASALLPQPQVDALSVDTVRGLESSLSTELSANVHLDLVAVPMRRVVSPTPEPPAP